MLRWLSKINKLEEQVNNIVRFGIIKFISQENSRVIVDLGKGIESPDLPYLINASGNARVYFVPKIGDQVLIISKSGSLHQAVVIPGIYKEGYRSEMDEWRLEFKQGEINYKEGKLIIKASTNISIEAPKAIISSDQIILGDDSGGEVVCKMHTCSFTGGPHSVGSSKIKGAM